MYQNTITLFNYHSDTDSWHTTVFTGVDLIASQGANATQRGQTNSDTVDLLINVTKEKRFNTATNIPDVHINKQYVSPKAYAALPAPNGYFTFSPESDFFIEGNHYSADPIKDSNSEDGLYNSMNAVYDGVYMIKSVTYYDLIPHFEIGGR